MRAQRRPVDPQVCYVVGSYPCNKTRLADRKSAILSRQAGYLLSVVMWRVLLCFSGHRYSLELEVMVLGRWMMS